MSYSHMIVAFGETSSTRDVWMDVAGSDGGVARTCKLQLPVRLQFPVLTLDPCGESDVQKPRPRSHHRVPA
jgi:hypothetical protein